MTSVTVCYLDFFVDYSMVRHIFSPYEDLFFFVSFYYSFIFFFKGNFGLSRSYLYTIIMTETGLLWITAIPFIPRTKRAYATPKWSPREYVYVIVTRPNVVRRHLVGFKPLYRRIYSTSSAHLGAHNVMYKYTVYNNRLFGCPENGLKP